MSETPKMHTGYYHKDQTVNPSKSMVSNVNYTPRTDNFALRGHGHLFEQADFDFCAQLERELAAVTAQRDDFKRALNEVVERHTSRP